jgi:hypothetical protein
MRDYFLCFLWLCFFLLDYPTAIFLDLPHGALRDSLLGGFLGCWVDDGLAWWWWWWVARICARLLDFQDGYLHVDGDGLGTEV